MSIYDPNMATGGVFAGTSTRVAPADQATRYGGHAAEPPPHMLTDVHFELVRLDERTPDGRLIHSDGFGVRDLPLSFSAQFTSADQHDGAEIVGSIDEVTIEPDGRVWGLGWLLDDRPARRAGRMIQAGALRGNSVELSASKTSLTLGEDDSLLMDFVESKLAATTMVGRPAMEGCTVSLVDAEFDFGVDDAELSQMSDTLAHFTEQAPAVFASTLVDEFPLLRECFDDPGLSKATPITVEDGRVFGHVALWDQPHLGNRMRAPRSRSNYAFFATGEVQTDKGPVATGRLVIGGDHAGLGAHWRAAVDHYAATSCAWADVAIGEDAFGIWVAGVVRPGVDADLLHAARASGLSGDWRRIGGSLELVAILSVNTPAFPVPRAFEDNGVAMALTGVGCRAPALRLGLFQQVPDDVSVLAGLARKAISDMIAEQLKAEMRAEARMAARGL